MREDGLEAPIRHPINWQDPDWFDQQKLDVELRRVFDICHGCRRCFNLCGSFPRLFDMIDSNASGELSQVDSAKFKPVVDACTLCDMCFMTKCPYVPPHKFNLDFPHLMLRYRMVEFRKRKVPASARILAKTDCSSRIANAVAPLANWVLSTDNQATRFLIQKVGGIHCKAAVPKFHGCVFTVRASQESGEPVNSKAPAFGHRKVVLYASCFINYNNTDIGMAIRAVLAKNGITTEIIYPRCCGMPQLEQGNIAQVVRSAETISRELHPWIEKGYDIIVPIPSCALMMKFEWPLILPSNDSVKILAGAVFDISEYLVSLSKTEGLAPGLTNLPEGGGITLHVACHARAQNMGQQAVELLHLIPGTSVFTIKRCSGHGGLWGVMKKNFPTALKIGKPVAHQVIQNALPNVASECPLAGLHIMQGVQCIIEDDNLRGTVIPMKLLHPIELFARAYGLKH
jgi:glycerol-3-phosphate dehydrogenase subunit C